MKPNAKKILTGLAAVVIIVLCVIYPLFWGKRKMKIQPDGSSEEFWKAPDTNVIDNAGNGNMIRYGRELILHTARYFGPKGTLAKISNGMNCDNCHIDAGTRIFANNFSMVAATYPLFRNRSGKLETVEMRINDCFARSLNGDTIENAGKEMKAIVAYLNWVGKDVPNGVVTKGAGSEKIPFLNRAADTIKGKTIYRVQCQVCHGNNGEGKLGTNGREYLYPPLWGPHSYNTGAGIYELSKFAGYIKNNMPFGTTYKNPQLTNEQAWDVAAFINSNPRPNKNLKLDWPDLSTKPFDYPFGPYTDGFSEYQHKYGPFKPIISAHIKKKNSR